MAATVGLWAAAVLTVWIASGGVLPFDRPALGPNTFLGQLLNVHAELAEQLLLIGLIVVLTRNRQLPDLAERAPARRTSRAEVAGLVAYAVGVQGLGYLIGRLLGTYAISLHLPEPAAAGNGTITPDYVWLWVAYNFLAYAVLPYLVFRRRGYNREQLQLQSSNLKADVRLVLIILAIESIAQLTLNHAIFNLTGRQLLIGAPLTFVCYFIGTCLPVMVFIYAILVPRYLRLTGSPTATVILGGLTYAAVHFFDAWGAFDTPADWLLTAVFVVFGYFGPGMVKTTLTLRTGNAWVHVWAYHAVAPHVWFDTPLIVDTFHIT